MSSVTCAISGLTFKIPFSPVSIPAKAGYFHPIFAASYKQLAPVYERYIEGTLSETDSYLLFLAYLHQSHKISYHHPFCFKPADTKLQARIASNFDRLIRVLEQTWAISTPTFKQSCFIVREHNCADMSVVETWIDCWSDNIADFKAGAFSPSALAEAKELERIEDKLDYFIMSGENTKKASQLARWADMASGGFPKEHSKQWLSIIRTCYNAERMFHTEVREIKAVKQYCEDNIPCDSIYFMALMRCLKHGITSHQDYLGGYTLLPAGASKSEIATAAIVTVATTSSTPVVSGSTTDIKERLRRRIAAIRSKKQ